MPSTSPAPMSSRAVSPLIMAIEPAAVGEFADDGGDGDEGGQHCGAPGEQFPPVGRDVGRGWVRGRVRWAASSPKRSGGDPDGQAGQQDERGGRR